MGQLAKKTATKTIKAAAPQDDFKALLKSQWGRIQAVIPSGTDPDRLFQLAVSAYNTTPKLAECSKVSMLSCVMKCASLGLEPSAVDGLGRAYILPYWNKKTGRNEAQVIIGYKGMLELARRSGQIKSIHAQAVYEGDSYEHWEDETGQHFRFVSNDVEHTPDKLTDVYMTAHLKDGGFVFETMTKREIDSVRDRSKAKSYGPWVTDYEAMALKTVIRRSFRYLPVSTQAKEAAVSDETTPDYSATLDPIITTGPEPSESDAVEPDVDDAETDGETHQQERDGGSDVIKPSPVVSHDKGSE